MVALAVAGLPPAAAGVDHVVGRRDHVGERHERYAIRLLTRIVPSQRWGIPPAAPSAWMLHFKGGWSPATEGGWRVNQVMLLRRAERRFSVAILTRRQPAKHYGEQTIEGVARRLLRGYNRLSR
ncbi:MAG: hypothetical protein ACRDKX_05215 [Solirubrobacterales bacterium]